MVNALMAMYKGAQTVGLKRNTGKTKVMFSCSMKDKVEENGMWCMQEGSRQ